MDRGKQDVALHLSTDIVRKSIASRSLYKMREERLVGDNGCTMICRAQQPIKGFFCGQVSFIHFFVAQSTSFGNERLCF